MLVFNDKIAITFHYSDDRREMPMRDIINMINNERVLMRFFHKENELFGFPLSAPPNKAGVTEDESYEKSLFFA